MTMGDMAKEEGLPSVILTKTRSSAIMHTWTPVPAQDPNPELTGGTIGSFHKGQHPEFS